MGYKAADFIHHGRQINNKTVTEIDPRTIKVESCTSKKHAKEQGRGVNVILSHTSRMKLDMSQVDHFLTFITGGHVVQDLPFGEKVLNLSTGESLKVPNVIRMMIPQRIIQQYEQFCVETGYSPLCRSTMRAILSECTASIRKSLQGLDYLAVQSKYIMS